MPSSSPKTATRAASARDPTRAVSWGCGRSSASSSGASRGRPRMTSTPCSAHGARLSTQGAERLGDVVLDLDADALTAWIADPTAT